MNPEVAIEEIILVGGPADGETREITDKSEWYTVSRFAPMSFVEKPELLAPGPSGLHRYQRAIYSGKYQSLDDQGRSRFVYRGERV